MYIYMYVYIYVYICVCIYIYKCTRTTLCFKSFYPEYFADNQIDKIIENNIFRRFDIYLYIYLSISISLLLICSV